jgi:hypothetical protein
VRRPSLAGVIAASLLAAGCAGVGKPDAPSDVPVGTVAPSGVLETMTVVLPASRGIPGGSATAILRATFVAPGVYADPQVVDLQAHADPMDADERERLERAALRAFEALQKWRFTPPPDVVLPAPGSRVGFQVRFVTSGGEAGRD